jgi:hypothetical protein
VRINVVQEGPKGREDEKEFLYTVTVYPSEGNPLEEAPEQGESWGA